MPSSKTQSTRDKNLLKIFITLPLLVTFIIAALRHVAAMLLRTCMDPPAAPGPTEGDNQLTAARGSTDPPAAHVDALVGALLGYLFSFIPS